eukprot:jgi/Tetstr1/461914/TSEL_006992.t1
MSGNGSSTAPKMVDAGKPAPVGGVGTTAIEKDPIEAARCKAGDIRLKQLIHEQLSMSFTTQETPMSPAAAGEEDAIPGGNESRADEYYHATCCGAFIAGSTVELRKLMAAACVTEGITPAFGQWLEAIVHRMHAIDDGHRFRLAYLRKHWDTQMHHGDTFALDVVRERYLRSGTENMRSPEFSELLELCKDRIYDANIASAAKTHRPPALRMRPPAQRPRPGRRRRLPRKLQDYARPGREAVAPRATFGKDATKESGKGKAKVEAPSVDKTE